MRWSEAQAAHVGGHAQSQSAERVGGVSATVLTPQEAVQRLRISEGEAGTSPGWLREPASGASTSGALCTSSHDYPFILVGEKYSRQILNEFAKLGIWTRSESCKFFCCSPVFDITPFLL